jgi:hypothetical protein
VIRSIRALAAVVCALSSIAAVVSAQTVRPSPRPARFTLSGGVVVDGGYSLGARDAILRPNGSGVSPFVLFHSDGRVESAAGVDARFGYAVSRSIAVEVGGTYSQPHMAVAISRDAEGAGEATALEDISQYTVDVSGIVRLPWTGWRARLSSYVIGGGGYLRQLQDDHVMLETGHTIFGGGGLQYSPGGARRRFPRGVRAELRYVHRGGGIDFENKSRGHVSFRALGFVGF